VSLARQGDCLSGVAPGGLGGCALGVLLSRGMGWRWVSRVAFRGEVHGGDLDFACSRLSRYEGSLLGSVGRAMES
jgi:hypothetical protein